MNAGIIVAAGTSRRLKTEINKPYLYLGDKYILNFSLNAFLTFKKIDLIVIVYRKEDKSLLEKIIENIRCTSKKKILLTVGGAERFNSVYNGLKKIKKYNIEKVFIHDAARPFLTQNLLLNLYKCSLKNQGVVPGINPVDTLKKISNNRFVINTIDRKQIVGVQTPQVFDYALLFKLYGKNKDWTNITDDAALLENFGIKVKVIKGDYKNIKITNKFDLHFANYIYAESVFE